MNADAKVFAAGDAVPDWLLSVEPLGPDSVFLGVVFAMPAVVTTVEGFGHFIQGTQSGPYVIQAQTQNCKLVAVSGPVYIATNWSIFPMQDAPA